MVIYQKLVSRKAPPPETEYIYFTNPGQTYEVYYCGEEKVTTKDPITEILNHFGTGAIIEIKLIASDDKIFFGEHTICSAWQVIADHKFAANIFSVGMEHEV